MYGLIAKMTAASGKREALAAILLDGTKDMTGCLSYVIAADGEDPAVLWITEVWTDAGAHKTSLSLPSARAAIEQGRPMITGVERMCETSVLGSQGLSG